MALNAKEYLQINNAIAALVSSCLPVESISATIKGLETHLVFFMSKVAKIDTP
jgi:hypothetical protein